MRINFLALKALRERSGFTQTQLAEASDIDRPNFAHIEAGRRPGTPDQIARIAEALRVPVGAIAFMSKDETAAEVA